ncbi:cytochrome C-551 [Nitrosomonas sp. HPC101]|uniref:c-type cytochrome n=1 Tax=Nitrosomonas sp. HPC101 TaxID=1658667 RepID=UPI00136AF76A|nr:c-type cytochrome [Nitrosomonas sp. HPC101]MXS85637.1 cytochrome C-551 [Nitrosomonas sp. HPC101]
MKTAWLGVFAASALLAVSSVQASPELAAQKNCVACHQMDAKLVGPSFKEVATKYAGKDDEIGYLASKIKGGSTGVWGQIPMPPNVNVNDDDAKALAEWISSLK